MRRAFLRYPYPGFIGLILSLPLWFLFACSQFADSTPCTTGRVLTAAQVRALFPGQTVICGDQSYAEVNPAFAPKWHDYTGSVMSLLGMSAKWSTTFDCNRFANVKLTVIHVRYLVDTWNERKPGQAPAAAEFWYIPDASKPDPVTGARVGHAIVVTIEGGAVTFRDIYTARALTLSATERRSAMLIKF